MTARPIKDRLLDRAWTEIGKLLENAAPPPPLSSTSGDHSISGSLSWPLACAALASGRWQSRGFRRAHAVREVVETLGLSDARYFAAWIAKHFPEWLNHERLHQINDWGNPLQAPAWILGLSRAFSPTSLRYLAHALWLKQEGLVKANGTIVEIGVGYGGLAAMNALVSGAKTLFIDLPEVTDAAILMMRENGLENHVADIEEPCRNYCLISNYAFTELSTELQDRYFERFVRHADRGFILSNASVFAREIRGRNNEELISWFTRCGVPAQIDMNSQTLCPSDQHLGNWIIRWNSK